MPVRSVSTGPDTASRTGAAPSCRHRRRLWGTGPTRWCEAGPPGSPCYGRSNSAGSTRSSAAGRHSSSPVPTRSRTPPSAAQWRFELLDAHAGCVAIHTPAARRASGRKPHLRAVRASAVGSASVRSSPIRDRRRPTASSNSSGPSLRRTAGAVRTCFWMVVSLLYRMTRCLLSVPAVLLRRDTSKEAELLVLRHENAVLRRQLRGRVRYETADRLWFASLSSLIPAAAGSRSSRWWT